MGLIKPTHERLAGGKKDKARRLLGKPVGNYPDTAAGREARQRLGKLRE